MKGWQAVALLLIVALVAPLFVKMVTGRWIMEYYVPAYGATFVQGAVSGESSRGKSVINPYTGKFSKEIPYIEDKWIQTKTWNELKTTVSGKCFMNWGLWDYGSINWTATINSPTSWTSYGVVIPGDITSVSSLPNFSEAQDWINLDVGGSWSNFLESVKTNITDFTTQFKSFLADPVEATKESFTDFLNQEYSGALTYLGVTEVPVDFVFTKPSSGDDGYGGTFGEGRTPEIILRVLINLDERVISKAGLPVSGENLSVTIMGILGQEDIWNDFLFGDSLPSWLKDIETPFSGFVQKISYLRFREPADFATIGNVNIEKIFGIPTGIDYFHPLDDGKFKFELSSERLSNYPSAIIATIYQGWDDWPSGSRISFTVKIPVVWSAVYHFDYSLGDTTPTPDWSILENTIPQLPSLENLIQPAEIDWETFFENFEFPENIFEAVPSPISAEELIENLPDIYLPPLPTVDVPVVTYQAGSSLPMMYASPNEPIEVEKPFLEPYMLDIAVVLIFIFTILGVVIWMKL